MMGGQVFFTIASDFCKTIPGSLGYIGDDTTQLHGDYYESL